MDASEDNLPGIRSLLDPRQVKLNWLLLLIADILPTHPNDVRAIFARERFSLGQDEIDAIIAAVQEHTEA